MPEYGCVLKPLVTWIPLWSEPALAPWPAGERNPVRAQRGWGRDELVLLYSGNMGLGHRFGEFLEASRRLGPSGPRWVFCGGGWRRREIEQFAQLHRQARVEVLDYVPQGDLRAHLCAADVHLASLDSDWTGLIVPSKIQASFAVGRPVLYVGGRRSESAVWIVESGGGWLVEEDDLEALLRALERAANAQERQQRGRAAYEFAQQHFGMATNCARLAELLERSPVHV